MSKKGKKAEKPIGLHGFPSESIDFEHGGFRLTVSSTPKASNIRLSAPDGTTIGLSVEDSDDRLELMQFLGRATGSVDHFIPAPDES